MNTNPNTGRTLLNGSERTAVTAERFGVQFPLRLEPFVFSMADLLAADYSGGFWNFYTLGNGGFYMAPDADNAFTVQSENGYEGSMSADALGITVCLYAFSHLSFGEGEFAETCAQHYHWLREYTMDHAEVGAILRATD